MDHDRDQDLPNALRSTEFFADYFELCVGFGLNPPQELDDEELEYLELREEEHERAPLVLQLEVVFPLEDWAVVWGGAAVVCGDGDQLFFESAVHLASLSIPNDPYTWELMGTLGTRDGSHPMPAALRWSEVEAIADALDQKGHELAALAPLLLHPFAVVLDDESWSRAVATVKRCWRGRGLDSAPPEPTNADYRSVAPNIAWEPYGEGWVLAGVCLPTNTDPFVDTVYTRRCVANGEFPHRELAMMFHTI